jgi:hypothetical protein
MSQNPTSVPFLGKFSSLAALTAAHPPALVGKIAFALTSDQGLVYANGTQWVTSPSAANSVPNAGSFNTIAALRTAKPAASNTAGLQAYTSDLGAAVNTGIGWVPLGLTYNVQAFGAVGDGTARPLSTLGLTLGVIQGLLYPSALSLTEEIDYNAVRRAIEVATAAGGGTVYIPKGIYIMNNASSQGNIQLPVNFLTTGTPGGQVNIKGDGANATILKWPSDSGANGSLFAMSCGPQASSFATPLTGGRYGNNQYFGYLEDFGMVGPNLTIVKGTVNANLSGLAWGARRFMNRVHIMGFYAGLDIVGDWTSFKDVVVENCFYDLYFPWKSASLYGDLLFSKCSFGNSARAACCIGTRGYMGAKFEGCYLGTSPYAFLNEAATQGTTADSSTHVTSTQFEKCLFENLGNSFIGDDNAQAATGGAGTRNFRWQQVDMSSCYWSFNSGQRDTTQSRNGNYAIVAASLKTFTVRGFTNFIPADIGLFQTDAVQGFQIYTDMTAMFSALQGGKYFCDPTIALNNAITFEWEDSLTARKGNAWRSNTATINQWDLLEFLGNRCVQGTTTISNPVLGAAMHSSLVTAGAFVLVCHTGSVTINAEEATPTGTKWVKRSTVTAGRVVSATGPTDTQVVGYANGANAGATPPNYNVLLSRGQIVGA